MAKQFTCRLGIAQISANLAYADELVSWMQEPFFPGPEEKTGLFTVTGIEEVFQLRQRIAEQYVRNLNTKIEAIARFAQKTSVELLVFPEYSIPPESLPLCRKLSNDLRIAIIAGSHVVTLNPRAQAVYREMHLMLDGTTDPETGAKSAACVVFAPEQTPISFSKQVLSRGEGYVQAGAGPFHSFEIQVRAGKLEVQVLICIEALREIPRKEKHSVARLVAIPAATPSTSDFHGRARLLLLEGKCTLFSNIAEFGGSKAFARAEAANFWFTDRDGSVPIPKGSEALVVLDADLEKQFEVRKSTEQHTAVSDLRVYPLLYPIDSSEAQQYGDIVQLLITSRPGLDDILKHVAPFVGLSPKVFPALLGQKLEHFVRHIVPSGTTRPEEAVSWVSPVMVPGVPSTNILRWSLCNDALEVVGKLQLSGKHVSRAKELMDVYAHLMQRRNELMQSIQSQERAVSVSVQPPELVTKNPGAESPFIDRVSAFDKIREFMNQQVYPALVLGGMRGIGKSALVSESFRQAIPSRRAVRLQLTEGMSYLRLLTQLAAACNLSVPDNLNLSAAEQQEVEESILSFMAQSGVVVVLDEFQYLLGPSGDVEDSSVREFLVKLLSATRARTKYFLVSHLAPRLGPELESRCMGYTLQGLDLRDTERLLIYWFHFRREDLAGQIARPSEKLVTLLGGHPLAINLAARLWAEHPSEDISEEISIFEELRDTIVGFILERIALSQPEVDLLSFASVFRLPVPRDAFLRWGGEQASYVLNSLSTQYVIESSELGYQLHPLVRDYYYRSLGAARSLEYHKVAARFYLHQFERYRNANKQIVPEFLGEAVHHFLLAGERNKVQDFAFYRQELKPVALEHFRKQDKAALKDYQVLAQLDDKDADAHYHLALIYARSEKWGEAELHFGKAMTLERNGYWILRGFGMAKVRGGKRAEGEALLRQAQGMNPRHAPTLVDIGSLREQDGDLVSAEDYYTKATEANPNYARAYYRLGRLLYRQDDISRAYEMARAALSCSPLDSRNKDLLRELQSRLGL